MVLNLIFKQIQIFQFGNLLRPHYELTQERWLRSFGQYFLFLRWNLCLVLGCLFDRRQHHGIRFVRGPFL